jgi:hypothetical protein
MGIHRASSLALGLTLGASTGCVGDPPSMGRPGSTTLDTASTSTTAGGSTPLDDTSASTSASTGTSTGVLGTTAEGQTTVHADPSTTGEPAPRAWLRALHLGMGIGSPTIDVYANGGEPLFEALGFRDGTGYVELPPGATALAITRSGEPVEAALLTPMLMLESEQSNTLAIIGDLTGAPGLQSIGLVDYAQGIAPGSVRITFVHAAHAMGPFDVFEVSGAPTALLEDLEFGGSAPLGDIPAPALAIGIEVELDDDTALDVTFDVDLTELVGQQLDLYVHNDAAGVPALVVQLADGQVLTIDAD